MAEDRMLSDEILLALIKKNSGGGGGGTNNYNQLENKPQIGGVTLQGNKTASDLGLVAAETGKGLSENDYTDEDQAIVGGVTAALASKQDVLTAGDYVSINNNEIKVRTSKGTELHSYKFTSEGGGYYLKVEKYVKGTKVSETTYSNRQIAGQEIDIDGVMTLTYTYAGYLWSYTLLTESREHLEGQTVSWYYSDNVEFTENFDIATNASKNLVLKEDLDAAISSAYHHAGTKTCVELVAGLLVAANEGNVYNMTDSGTTTADFIEGAGQPIKEGDNVGIAKISDGVYKFDLLSGFVDTTNFVQKSVTAGLLKNDGTVNDEIEDDVDSLKSGLTNLDNEVNGDATVYQYADVITIPDAVPSNLADCSVKIEPVQSGSGDPSPTNIRPITGHTQAVVTVADDAESPTMTETYTIALGDTIYGGTVDFDSGVMTVDRAVVDLGTLNYNYNATDKWYNASISNMKLGEVRTLTMLCECYQCIDDGRPFVEVPDSAVWNGGNSGDVYIRDTRYTDPTDLTTALDGMQLVYPIATPTTIQLTPQQIQLLKGQNTLTASTGQISVTVNGVSGSIGAVQEQVNGLAEDVAEVQSGLAKLHYHKVAESADTGTRADKLASLYTTYNTLLNDVRKSAILLRNNADIFHAVNNSGAFSSVYLDANSLVIVGVSLNPGSFVVNSNGTTTDGSSTENTEVYSLWIIE